jgi:putative hydrolase of the HAD superfamily
MEIRAVIFDRDNTLVYFDEVAVTAIEARIGAIAPSLPAGAVGGHWDAWPGPWPRSAADEPWFWGAFWGELVARYALSDTAAAALHQLGAFYHTCFVAFPDAVPCLHALRSRGLRLAVLTNFELPSIDLTLQYAGIAPEWFAALLSSSTLGVYKPAPYAYQAAAAALDLPPEACLFVDDLPDNVAAAGAIGMRAVLLDRANAFEHAGLDRIDSLDDLAALIA